MANKGRADVQVMLDLHADITDFIDIITEEIEDIRSEAKGLSSDWSDGQYDEFLSYVEELTRSLESDIDGLEQVRNGIKKEIETLE